MLKKKTVLKMRLRYKINISWFKLRKIIRVNEKKKNINMNKFNKLFQKKILVFAYIFNRNWK